MLRLHNQSCTLIFHLQNEITQVKSEYSTKHIGYKRHAQLEHSQVMDSSSCSDNEYFNSSEYSSDDDTYTATDKDDYSENHLSQTSYSMASDTEVLESSENEEDTAANDDDDEQLSDL